MKKKRIYIVGAVLAVLFLIGVFRPSEEKDQDTVTVQETKTETHEDTLKRQFSVWNGSHPGLVKLVKDNLNDPKSFEHVETNYIDYPNQHAITVMMTYRAKNAFGGIVTNKINARVDYSGNVLKIIE